MFLFFTVTRSFPRETPKNAYKCSKIYDLDTNGIKTMFSSEFPICFNTTGSIFFNSKPVHITIYENDKEIENGTGVAAILSSKPTIVKVVADKNISASVIGGIVLNRSSEVYISNKLDTKRVNIMLGKTKSSYLYLSQHEFTSVYVITSYDVNCYIYDGGSKNQTVFSGGENFDFRRANYVLIGAQSFGYHNSVEVEISSEGAKWETEFDGMVSVMENHILRENDFRWIRKALSNIEIYSVAFGSLSFVVLVSVLILFFCKSRNEDNRNTNTKDMNSVMNAELCASEPHVSIYAQDNSAKTTNDYIENVSQESKVYNPYI